MVARNLLKRNTSFTLNRIMSKLLWKMETSGDETPYLPEQVIMEEILPRLPVKSLLKFRCVSKPWCSLIGSKRFIKAHLKYSIKTSNNCIFRDYYKYEFKQCSLADKVFAHSISPFADLGIRYPFETFSFVGCCNGLVCILVHNKRFILWNPATKKFKNLPYSNPKISHASTKDGFGFDELNDDYKVFVTGYEFDVTAGNVATGKIYSLKSNSWKDIEERDVSVHGGAGVYVGGKLYWIDREKGGIFSFDLNRHVYEVVELPNYPNYTKGVNHSLRTIGGCISAHFCLRAIGGCLSAHFRHPNGDLDVWVMKGSWDKVVTIPYYDGPGDKVPYYGIPGTGAIPTPLAIAANGEILLVYDLEVSVKYNLNIVIYNPNSNMFRKPHIPELHGMFAGDVCMGIYMESLASVES